MNNNSNSYTFKWIKEEKFSINSLRISFVTEYNKLSSYEYRVICSLLNMACEKYQTKKDKNFKSLSLYEADAYWTCIPLFKSVMFEFSISFISPNIANYDTYLDDIFDYAKELLFRPLLNEEKCAFDNKNFEESIRALKGKIEANRVRKHLYAYMRFFDEMKRMEELKHKSLLDFDVNVIDNKKLYETYKNIFENSYISICGIGDISEEKIAPYIKSLGLKSNIDPNNILAYDDKCKLKYEDVKEKKEIYEHSDVNQTRMYLGYRLDLDPYEDDTYVFSMFNKILGGAFDSSLVDKLREKESLCYEINSNYLIGRGILYIYIGLDSKNVKKARVEIEKVIKDYQTSKVLDIDSRLKRAKDAYFEKLEEEEDIYFARLSHEASEMIPFFRKRRNEIIEKITKEDITRVANKIKLDTIYVLWEKKDERK